MPLLLNRRRFIRTAAGAASSAFITRMSLAEPKTDLHWALLSDIHIAADAGDTYRGFHPHENLRRVLGQVRGRPFDAMAINGDIARLEGKPGDYEAVTGYLEPITDKLPLAITLGNHDDRKNCRSAFASVAGDVQPVEKKFVLSLDTGPLEFLFLDSLATTNAIPGQLGDSQRKWLSDYLGRLSKPCVVFVHHNPDVGDTGGLLDAAQFLQIVIAAKPVKAVLYGHTHAWRHETRDGLHLVNLPAVAYNFKDSEPIGWVDARFSATTATLQLNAIAGNTASNGQVLTLSWR